MASNSLTNFNHDAQTSDPKFSDLSDSLQEKIMSFYQSLWKAASLEFISDNVKFLYNSMAKKGKMKTTEVFLIELNWKPVHDENGQVEQTVFCFEHNDPCLLEGGLEWKKINDLLITCTPNDLVVLSHHALSSCKDDGCTTKCLYEEEGELKTIRLRGALPFTSVYHVLKDAVGNVGFVVSDKENRAKNREKAANKTKEYEQEDELYSWLIMHGIHAHRQVKTSSNNVFDIWIPDQMLIEIKRGTVTGNDVCQAIEYSSQLDLPVLLIGKKLTSLASKGLSGFNSLVDNQISFVDWTTAKTYLKGKFNIT